VLGSAASVPFIIHVVLGYFTILPLTVALTGSGTNGGRGKGATAVVTAIVRLAVALGLGMSPTLSIAFVLSFGIATAQLLVPLSERTGVYRTEAAAVVGATTVAMAVSLPALIWICSQIWPGPMVGPL
jgi:hypothetical protein